MERKIVTIEMSYLVEDNEENNATADVLLRDFEKEMERRFMGKIKQLSAGYGKWLEKKESKK